VREYVQGAFDLWDAGGWGMIPLSLTAFILYFKCADVLFTIWLMNFRKNKHFGGRKVVSRLGADNSASASAFAAAQRYLAFFNVRLNDDDDYGVVSSAFQELRNEQIPPIDRDLRFISVAIAAAPLWGLLGTVTGMLTTFHGLASGGGGEKTMNVIAGGISEALITTETGLMVALPGYFLHYIVSSKRDKFDAFIEHLMNAVSQRALKREDAGTPREASAA
jgi:biopolymer transport protein ExbB